MDAEYSKGQRLFVETKVGTLEGVFYSMDRGHNRLTLTEVVLHPSGKKMEGFSHYYRSEVISVHTLNPGACAGVITKSEAAGNWNSMHKDQQANSMHKDQQANSMHKDQQAVQPGKVRESDVMNTMLRDAAVSRSNPSEEEYDAVNKLVDNHVLIKHMGDEFRKAVEDIKAEPTVGLSLEGATFGRHSQASLLSISTPSHAFLFDIYTLGDAAFDNGLRDILESKKIEKVIHNCRILSDYLHHKHGVTICGVFDTQVADLKVRQQRYGQLPRSARSLPQCLRMYLNLPENLVCRPQIRDGNIVLDSQQWNKRPLSIELEMSAVKNLVFLLQLRKKIWDELCRPFYQCVDVFLGAVRDQHEPGDSEYAVDAELPSELFSLYDEP
jgi:exonuclease 3'-5' domain-containing protein 1